MLERIISKLEGGSQQGLIHLCLLAQYVFTHWRARFPAGVRARLLHRLGLAWIDAEKIFGTDGRGRNHIGFEYLVNDALMRRAWLDAFDLAKRAQREGWDYDWPGAIAFAEHKINAAS